jgi:penicillin-binding protein 1A
VAIAWVGYDQPRTLGKNQTGGVVALPIWVSYMEKALKDVPEMPRDMPPGVVVVPTLPYPAVAGEARLMPEYFYREAVPPPEVLQPPPPPVPPTPVPQQPAAPPA